MLAGAAAEDHADAQARHAEYSSRTVLTAFADRARPVLLVVLLVALATSITAIQIVGALLMLATLVRLRAPAARRRFQAPLAAPVLAFAAVSFASAALAREPWDALDATLPVVWLALFWAALDAFEDAAHVRRALGVFFAAIAVASVYALAQAWACTTSVPLPDWVGAALKVRLAHCRVTLPFRAKGFFSIYMTLGGSLTIALALLLARLAAGGRRAWRALPPTLLALIALGLTLVRGAWLGLAAAIGLLLVLSRRLALVLPIAGALVVALVADSPFQARLFSTLDPTESTARERLYFWRAGARMVREAPLFGLGPGAVRRDYPAYKDPEAARPRTSHLHNNLVQIAAERGLLGLAAWLWIWLAFYRRAAGIYRGLPRGRGEERALVAGSLAAVTGFLVMGLFEYNFGDAEVIDLLLVVMALPFVVARDAASRARAPART